MCNPLLFHSPRQKTPYSCGIACLEFIAKMRGLDDIDSKKIEEMIGVPDKSGTDCSKLIEFSDVFLGHSSAGEDTYQYKGMAIINITTPRGGLVTT